MKIKQTIVKYEEIELNLSNQEFGRLIFEGLSELSNVLKNYYCIYKENNKYYGKFEAHTSHRFEATDDITSRMSDKDILVLDYLNKTREFFSELEKIQPAKAKK